MSEEDRPGTEAFLAGPPPPPKAAADVFGDALGMACEFAELLATEGEATRRLPSATS